LLSVAVAETCVVFGPSATNALGKVHLKLVEVCDPATSVPAPQLTETLAIGSPPGSETVKVNRYCVVAAEPSTIETPPPTNVTIGPTSLTVT